MSEDNFEFGFSKNHMIFSACKTCRCFRPMCFDDKCGFSCALGDTENYFIPFDYPLMGNDMKRLVIRNYQKNSLPNGAEKKSEPCVYHTQCAMLCISGDDDSTEETLQNEYEAVVQDANGIDFNEPVFEHAKKKDPDFESWCRDTPNAKVAMLKKEGAVCAFATMVVETDADYSWIQPAPPEKHYFQEGDTRLGIMKIFSDEKKIPNATRLLISLVYDQALKAEEEIEEIYAVIGSSLAETFMYGGFKGAGYKYGGKGESDDDAEGSFVLVKKLRDLLDGE